VCVVVRWQSEAPDEPQVCPPLRLVQHTPSLRAVSTSPTWGASMHHSTTSCMILSVIFLRPRSIFGAVRVAFILSDSEHKPASDPYLALPLASTKYLPRRERSSACTPCPAASPTATGPCSARGGFAVCYAIINRLTDRLFSCPWSCWASRSRVPPLCTPKHYRRSCRPSRPRCAPSSTVGIALRPPFAVSCPPPCRRVPVPA